MYGESSRKYLGEHHRVESISCIPKESSYEEHSNEPSFTYLVWILTIALVVAYWTWLQRAIHGTKTSKSRQLLFQQTLKKFGQIPKATLLIKPINNDFIGMFPIPKMAVLQRLKSQRNIVDFFIHTLVGMHFIFRFFTENRHNFVVNVLCFCVVRDRASSAKVIQTSFRFWPIFEWRVFPCNSSISCPSLPKNNGGYKTKFEQQLESKDLNNSCAIFQGHYNECVTLNIVRRIF